ncbi:MAG: PIG-L family deacetylase [bacterium]
MPSKNFTKTIVVYDVVLLIFPIIVNIISLTLWIRLLVWIVYLFFIVYSGFILWLYHSIQKKNKTFIQSKGEVILIIAPHQDDCVAIAGGYAVQTVEKGGHVHILYTTDGYQDDKVTRKQEAVKAWSMLGTQSVTLDFLPYNNNASFLYKEEIDKVIDEIGTYILKVRPETIFIPLYEGGHYQHDVTNYMVSKALEKFNVHCSVYESPVYNFYMSLKTTPEKILSGLVRFIPLVSYDYPPEPVRNDKVYFLKMTDAQLQKKKDIISEFKTQTPHKLIERWGFCDRYQKQHAYDYSKPPFNYKKSIAKKVHKMKSLPLIGKVMRKMMIWSTTIHPDPYYTMTKIPL